MRNNNGLLINDDGSAVGYLIDFAGRGIYSPDGKTDVSAEDAKRHNELLDKGLLDGLARCQIGQYGTFYLKRTQERTGILAGARGWLVTTWLGTLVSERVRTNGNSITFLYPMADGTWGRFQGRMRKDADCFNFRRVNWPKGSRHRVA